MTIIISKSKIVILLLLLSVFYVGSALGKTYYVDTTTGSDNNKTGNGSVSSPWKTIAHALDNVGYDSIISINDGIYSEGQLVVPEGVSLTSTSKNNTKVHIQPNTSLDIYNPFLLLSSAIPGRSGNQEISYLEIDGVNGGNVARVGIKVQNRNYVRITNCNIHDFKGVVHSYGVLVISTQIEKTGKLVLFWPADAQSPNTNTNLDAVWPANPVEKFELDYNTITDCGFRTALNKGPITGSVAVYNLKNSYIHDNIIDSTNSLAQNIIGYGQMIAFLWDVKIYNNRLTMPRYTDRSSYIMELWVFRNCEIYNNTANANFSLTASKKLSIYDNTIVHDPPQGVGGGDIGIEATAGTELEIYGNFVSGNLGQSVHVGLTSIFADKDYTLRNITVRDNKFTNNKSFGISVSAGGSKWVAGKKNTVTAVKIHDNVVDTNRATEAYSLIHLKQYDMKGTGVMSDVIVENNVLINGPGYAGKTSGTVRNVVIDHNQFFGNKYNYWQGGTATRTITTDPGIDLVTDSNKDAAFSKPTLGPDTPLSDTVIGDNTNAAFSTVGSWGTSSFIPGFYGSNYRWANAGSGTNQATWSFSVSAGDYELSAQWAEYENRASNAAYRVYDNGVEIGTQLFDQRVNGGRFNVFDKTFTVSGGTLDVVLTDDADGGAIADAVKVVKLPISSPSGFKIGAK